MPPEARPVAVDEDLGRGVADVDELDAPGLTELEFFFGTSVETLSVGLGLLLLIPRKSSAGSFSTTILVSLFAVFVLGRGIPEAGVAAAAAAVVVVADVGGLVLLTLGLR